MSYSKMLATVLRYPEVLYQLFSFPHKTLHRLFADRRKLDSAGDSSIKIFLCKSNSNTVLYQERSAYSEDPTIRILCEEYELVFDVRTHYVRVYYNVLDFSCAMDISLEG